MGSLLIIPIFLMNKRAKDIFFVVFAILAAVAALYHFIGNFYKINSSSVRRHIFFIFISIICVYGLLKRPAWFILFFFVLLVQQLYSHGGDIIWHWRHGYHIDWISVAVLTFMPVVFVLLLLDRRKHGE